MSADPTTDRTSPPVEAVVRPNLLLAGVTKAGTTSLVHYLGQHPDVSIIPGKGVDHFTPLRFGPAELPPIEQYFAAFAGLDTDVVLDGSITYFTGGQRLVEAVHAALPDARVLVILREPVARMWSAYKMKRSQGTLPDDVDTVGQFVDRCIALAATGEIDRPENVTFRTFTTAMYVDHLEHWWATYGDAVRVMFFEDLAERPRETMASLFEWLDVPASVADDIVYTVRNRSVQHRSRVLRRLAVRTFRANFDFLGRHQRLTRFLGRAYRRLNASEFSERFPADVRERLAEAYAPANARLAAALRDRGYRDLPAWLDVSA